MSQAMDALIERANTYSDTVCQETGARPTAFPVTEEEYEVLLRACQFQALPVSCLPPLGDVYIAGMRVLVPERFRDERLWASLGVPPDLVGFGTTAPAASFGLFNAGLIDWLQAQVIATMERSMRTAQGVADDPLPPKVDSETSLDEDWEAGIHAMIADVEARHSARLKPR